MEQPQIQSEVLLVPSPAVGRQPGDSIYQLAIVLAVLLVIVSMSLF
ncbi:MAG TPA: hypothetical protein VE109_04025 [Acidobacteriaceae bacterium]|nr:hypothetical protein [Acidobacteriaceae bacterium]